MNLLLTLMLLTAEPPECAAARERLAKRFGVHECQQRPLPDGGSVLAYVIDFRTVRLQFASGSATLNDADLESLKALARLVSCSPSLRVSVEGHVDSKEPAELSAKRAGVVRDALLAAGAPADRISMTSREATRPLAANDSADGRTKNRRVELQLTEE